MPFCTQCGQQVKDADIFCGHCGRQQTGPLPGVNRRPSSGAPPIPGRDPLAGISPHVASILCYIPTVGWIAAVIVLAAQKFRSDKIVRFHAFQGLYLFAAWLLVQWVIQPVISSMPGNPVRVDHILQGLLLAVSVFMIIKASHGDAYVLPIIGELAHRSASEQ